HWAPYGGPMAWGWIGSGLLGVALATPSIAWAQPPAPHSEAPAEAEESPPAEAEEPPEAPLMPPAAAEAPAPEPKKAPPPKPDEGRVAARADVTGATGEAETAPAPKEKPPEKEAPQERDISTEISSEIFAEDWWQLSRPTFEIHGYYRLRSNFRSNFALGRFDAQNPIWPQPPDNSFVDLDNNAQSVVQCGDNADRLEECRSNTQAGANMRFRLNPELLISDNVRVRAQIDLLDNVVLGSTPEGYANAPAPGGGYQVVARGGYSPLGTFTTTQWSPSAGVNSTRDSISVTRVWGEYSTPIGELRFGRMPSHWGLGILANSGDSYDSDWQTTVDRLQFIFGVKSWDFFVAASWDFANEGPTSAVLNEQQGEIYDLSNRDDVDQWTFIAARRLDDKKAKEQLLDGGVVVEGGTYVIYRQQELANDALDPAVSASLGQDRNSLATGLLRRGAQAVIPDAWFRFRYEKFRFEFEGTMFYGSIDNTLGDTGAGGVNSDFENPRDPDDNGWNIRQFGFATESEYKALDDKLRVALKIGFASGDSDVEGLAPTATGVQPQLTADRTFSTFRFHPNYRVDLILFRNLLTRVQGAYYFRPEVGYEFIRDPDGQKIGADAGLVWSRASEFVQTPGNGHDLGIELNFRLYYQAKDGVLNDDPDKMGGFFTSLEYAALFPLGGLGYLNQQE
ncbi:MAG: TIGR04551 family protein, partial [Myxococcota bacterium]